MFGIFESALYTMHRGQSGGRGLSPRLWSQLRGQNISPDGSGSGYGFKDDFLNTGRVPYNTAANTAVSSDGGCWGAYTSNTSGTTILPSATDSGGVVVFSTPATTNTEAYLCGGCNTGAFGAIDDSSSAGKKLIFEARFKVGQLAKQGFFVGFSAVGQAAAGALVDTTLVPKDVAWLGFNIAYHASASTLSFVYKKAGQTMQTPITVSSALVSDTWYKVGFIYDPAASPSERLKVYLDNVEVFKSDGTRITHSDLIADTFPKAVPLAPFIGFKSYEAATKTASVDWAAPYQDG